MDWFFLTMSPWLVLVFRPALSQVPNKDVRREYRLSSTSPLNSSHDVTTEMLRTYLELGTFLRSLLSCGFCPLSTEGVCSRTGEYVFDFAVVVLGVRVSILARPFHGRLPRGLRACSVLTFLTTAFQFFRAETLGGLRDVATRTHARGEHVSPFSHHCITLHMSLNIRLDTPFP